MTVTMCMLTDDFLSLTRRSLENHSVVTDPRGERQRQKRKGKVREGMSFSSAN